MNETEIDAEIAKMNEKEDPADAVDQDIKKADTENPEDASDDVAKQDIKLKAPGKAPADKGSTGDAGDETIDGNKAADVEDEKVADGEPEAKEDDEELQGNAITNEDVKKKD